MEVDKGHGRTFVYCGDKKGRCDFSKGKSGKLPHAGIPVLVVDEEIYHRPSSVFVAGFIGVANLIPAVVVETTGAGATVDAAGSRLGVARTDADLRPGDNVLELEAGRGWYSEIISTAIGPTGKLVVQ